jgi:hypothetical protein
MILKPLERPRKPAPVLVWDVEAKPAYQGEPVNTEWLGGGFSVDGEHVEIERNQARFFQRLLSPEFAGFWLYAHNASGYDDLFLLRYLQATKIPWSATRTGQRLIVKVLDRLFLDSAAVLPGSLRSIAQTLGVKTKKWDVPADFYRRIEHYPWPEYLADDCRALFQSIEATRAALSSVGCVLKPTLASSALALWRQKYLTEPIETPDPWDSSEVDVRAAYTGGRVEVLRPTMGRGASYDINSAFPYAMRDPAGVPCECLGARRGDARGALRIAKACIKIPAGELYPMVATRAKDNRLWWASGHVSGWYTGAEVDAARQAYGSKAVVVSECYVYHGRDLFSAYVRDLYALKSNKNTAAPIKLASKLLLNSLYGKFGQRREREKIVCGEEWLDWPLDSPGDAERLTARGIDPRKRALDLGRFLFALPDYDDRSSHIAPQIAAYITARARLQLREMLVMSNGRAAYCDTDSVYVDGNQAPYLPLCGEKLGQIKAEHEIERGEFAAPKVYWIKEMAGGEYARAKGLRRSDVASVQRYANRESVRVGRVLGVFESLRRKGEICPSSENQSKQMVDFTPRRKPNGETFTTHELKGLGLL